jgi:hypothetical protein
VGLLYALPKTLVIFLPSGTFCEFFIVDKAKKSKFEE